MKIKTEEGFSSARLDTKSDNQVLAPAAQGCAHNHSASKTSNHSALMIPEEQIV